MMYMAMLKNLAVVLWLVLCGFSDVIDNFLFIPYRYLKRYKDIPLLLM